MSKMDQFIWFTSINKNLFIIQKNGIFYGFHCLHLYICMYMHYNFLSVIGLYVHVW